MGIDIGIDLGTTNSLCAVFRDGRPELIPNVHGSVLTPSVVGVMDDGQMLVGMPAKELRVTRPGQCAWCFKRWMGTNRKIRLGNRDYNAPELSSFILKSLKDDAESFLGETVIESVITVPAYFNDHQRKATKLAAELAGLRVRRIINEPTAAALTYGFHEREAAKKLMVIDLGGGTFDVTLMEIFEGGLEIISTAGESQLGGEDFTNRLVAIVLKQLGKEYETTELKVPRLFSRLHEECERAKRQLFESPQSRIRIPNEDGEINPNAISVVVTREAFAKACRPLTDRLKGPIGKALRDAKFAPNEIDDLILAGGATRMPVVVDFIREFLSAEPLAKFNPDEVVALGAAVQAALISDNSAVSDMVMTDVCPFTLGIEMAKEFGNHLETGFFSPIIHRNTTIPVSKEQMFQTVATNQTEVKISVYQGEGRKVKENLKLGELSVKGIPPGPAGQPFLVRFTYDVNGLLEVEACIPETGRTFQTVLTNHAADLTPQEIAEAVEKMRAIKFYPRDDVKNRQLILFCERLVGEISPHQRQELEEAIDAFEHAMSSGDREMFEAVRNGLLIHLSSLGIEYEAPETEAGQDDGDLS